MVGEAWQKWQPKLEAEKSYIPQTRDHIFIFKHKAESEPELWQGSKLWKPTPSDIVPLAKLHSRKIPH